MLISRDAFGHCAWRFVAVDVVLSKLRHASAMPENTIMNTDAVQGIVELAAGSRVIM